MALPYPGMDFTPFNTLPAADLDKLVANIEALADGSAVPGTWRQLGRTTLGSAGDTISVTPLAAKKYIKVIVSVIQSGANEVLVRFNNDSANNYAGRYSGNNAADTLFNTSAALVLASSETSDKFGYFDVVNIAAKEKLLTGHALSFGTAGVGNSPTRWDATGKWVNTSAQITRVDIINTQAGDFAIGSEVIVLGHD